VGSRFAGRSGRSGRWYCTCLPSGHGWAGRFPRQLVDHYVRAARRSGVRLVPTPCLTIQLTGWPSGCLASYGRELLSQVRRRRDIDSSSSSKQQALAPSTDADYIQPVKQQQASKQQHKGTWKIISMIHLTYLLTQVQWWRALGASSQGGWELTL
jgi:hypothetical protein